MQENNDISNELLSLSPLIAGMRKPNVFEVPDGYFESISETVLACIREEQGNLPIAGHKQTHEIPDGYFDHLAASILNKIKAEETAEAEIRNVSPLLHSLQKKQVFDVPDGYFESLQTGVLYKLTTVDSGDELNELSPLLSQIQHKEVFDVPDGYFASLPVTVLKKVNQPTAKIVSLYKRSQLIKYAVAAMMTGIFALGLYKYIDKPAKVPTNGDSIAVLDASIEKGRTMNEKQFNETLENLSEADIAKYLESNGDITDMAALGNNIESKDLPNVEDYLLDETTLENYLKEIENTSTNN